MPNFVWSSPLWANSDADDSQSITTLLALGGAIWDDPWGRVPDMASDGLTYEIDRLELGPWPAYFQNRSDLLASFFQ